MFSIESSRNDFPKRSGKRFKVVVNSGGGIFGYIISNFMSYLNFDLYSKVDLIAGTSIGGVLSLAYCLNDNYAWINKLFKIAGQKIFADKKMMFFNGVKYDNTNLKNFLKEVYGDARLSDIKQHVLITTTDFTLRTLRLFENINLKKEQDLPLIDLALFTSAAPTFFNAHSYPWRMLDYDLNEIPLNEKFLLLLASNDLKIDKDALRDKSSILFDGGVLENIPIISAYTALHTEFGAMPEDIDMFVIGTGNRVIGKEFTLPEVNHWSTIEILKNLIIPYVVESNVQTSLYWGMQMGFNSFKYFNPVTIRGQMDDVSIIPEIEKQCKQHKNKFIEEIELFLNK